MGLQKAVRPQSASQLAAVAILIAALLGLFGPPAWAQGIDRHVDVELLAESPVPAPGAKVRLALVMTPKPGWHSYWVNPGDSGSVTQVEWSAPSGSKFGPLQHPAPKALSVAGFVSYVHEGAAALLADLTLPASAEVGSAYPVRAKVRWLACSDALCVPETAMLSLSLTVGDGTIAPGDRQRFDGFARALPIPLKAAGVIALKDGTLEVSIPFENGIDSASAKLFPATADVFAASAQQTVERSGDRLIVRVPSDVARLPREFVGVIASRAGPSYAFAARTDAQAAAAASQTPSIAPARNAATAVEPTAAAALLGEGKIAANGLPSQTTAAAALPEAQLQTGADTYDLAPPPRNDLRLFFGALIGAVIGGLLLNLMPCVFPILSLKALGLARAASSERAARVEALAFTGGAVAACLALGSAIVAVRAAGIDIGWAFQLQDPRVVFGLLVLVTVIGLNLAGLFELGSFGFSGRSRTSTGATGAFGSGALAAFVATPCSGPFMGAALGVSLVLPLPAALAVFAGLGLGLALPFLAIGFLPRLRSRLPRPGAWMVTFRHLLALPMFATAVWLAWILGRQAGADGLTLGLGATTVAAIGLWWAGTRQRRGLAVGWLPLAPAALAAILVAIALPAMGSSPAAPLQGARTMAFDENTLARLRAAGTPVFVDFTADWCLVCQVNERLAINTERTRAAFAKAGVVTLVGDWTHGDARITRFLAAHGRNSIPFYLYYPPGSEAKVLPQILTSALLEELARAPMQAGSRPANIELGKAITS